MASALLVVPVLLIVLAFGWLALAWYGAGTLIHPARRAPAKTPADYGLAFEPVEFRTRDGLTLRGWFVPAKSTRVGALPAVQAAAPASPEVFYSRETARSIPGGGDGSEQAVQAKGTIVFSHGYAGDASPDLVYAPLFHAAGYDTFFFHYRAHGASEGRSTSVVHFERGDLVSALDYLRLRRIERVGLIGFSMGGAIALSAASLSQMVVGVVSDSAFAELDVVVACAAVRRGMPQALAKPFGWLVEWLAGARLRANLFASDPIHWVDRIAPRPVLIMHGAEDEDVPVSEAKRLYDAAGGPKQLWIVPGAGHRRIEDVAPDEYRRKIIAFFDRVFQTKE